MRQESPNLFAQLPKVDRLIDHADWKEGTRPAMLKVRKSLLNQSLGFFREQIKAGKGAPSSDEVMAKAAALWDELSAQALCHAINATGVILHTNLGRAPLSETHLLAMARELQGYCTLEINRETANRGSRTALLEKLLTLKFSDGSSRYDALVVNNNAAAVLLALQALGRGQEVILSRSEMVQIGGGFRVPEILKESGALLEEVGTTNITEVADYQTAIASNTAAILKIHQSCFTIVGHTKAPSLSALSRLSVERGVPLVLDLGSGCNETAEHEETTVESAVRSGASVVCFSGDKLLGGAQAGILIGQKPLISKLRKCPLYRALRLGKMEIFILEQILLADLRQELSLTESLARISSASLKTRAEMFQRSLAQREISSDLIPSTSTLGGGTQESESLPAWLVSVSVPDETAAAARLSRNTPAIFCRVGRGALEIDLRTVFPEEEPTLLKGIACLFSAP